VASRWIQQTFQDRDFAPVPRGAGHYVAAVQNKSGELNALANASMETWTRLTPLIQIVGAKTRPVAYKRDTVVGWVRRISKAVGQRPCFLDIVRLRPGHPTRTPSGTDPVLTVIHAAARKQGMAFVPVFPIGRTDSRECVSLVGDTAACDGRGAALRFPIRRVALEPGTTHTTVLADALRSLRIDVTSVDVLVDLGYLSEDEELHTEDVSEALKEVIAVGP
jgi:hypothetical protein